MHEISDSVRAAFWVAFFNCLNAASYFVRNHSAASSTACNSVSLSEVKSLKASTRDKASCLPAPNSSTSGKRNTQFRQCGYPSSVATPQIENCQYSFTLERKYATYVRRNSDSNCSRNILNDIEADRTLSLSLWLAKGQNSSDLQFGSLNSSSPSCSIFGTISTSRLSRPPSTCSKYSPRNIVHCLSCRNHLDAK